MLHTSGSKAPKTNSAPNSGSDVSVSLQEVGADFKMEPMIRIERTTYALRKQSQNFDNSSESLNSGFQLPEEAEQISQDLAGKIRKILNLARSACSSNAPPDPNPSSGRSRSKGGSK
jgi:hypothetical protein